MFKEPTSSNTVSFNNLPDAVRFKPMLNNLESVRRGLASNYPLPEIPNGWRLLPLGEGLANRTVVNVVELFSLEGGENIHADNPIRIRLEESLLEGRNTLLPVGYDAESGSFYPIGSGMAEGEIWINDIPTRTSSTIRSLGGSSKIFFFQLDYKYLPYVYNYPQLAVAQWSNDDTIEYQTDINDVREQVNKANKILVLVHGLLSTTQSIASSIQNSDYDLILTFDYENMDTSITDTAYDFKNRLKDIGIVSGSDKRIDIIAYDIGGLLTRWLIEKLDGKNFINHLYLVGTPNLGSPYGSLSEIAAAMSSNLFNQPVNEYENSINAILIGMSKDRMFITLKQMNTDSDFLKDLNDGTDPEIPYTIIAGNTQLMSNGPRAEIQTRLLSKVMAKFKSRGHYDAIDLLLFKAPNDLLASTESILTIPGAESRQFPPRIIECACDHLGYFTSEEGKRALKSALNDG